MSPTLKRFVNSVADWLAGPAANGTETDPPDSIPIHEFWGDERYGRLPFAQSRDPFTCGVTGRVRTNADMAERLELLARALAARLGWHPNLGTPWDKVVGVFSFNSVSFHILQ